MLFYPDTLWLLVAALALDALVGDPDWIWRKVPHPVVLFGKLIAALDKRFNKTEFRAEKRRLNGVFTLLILLLCGLVLGALIQLIASLIPFGQLIVVMVAAVFIAQKSLYQHVAAVRDGLTQGGINEGRKAVAMIVGRDPQQLDETGISRAAIESCAENFSDGVVAPVFWFALLGLPGLLAYKAINTADSMIGHKNDTYSDFGWASARFDDLVNLPASRLSALFVALGSPIVGGSIIRSIRCALSDASKHRSPNAGWPEATMAGALNLSLAGPRAYTGYIVDDPYLNEHGRRTATARDISNALKILFTACTCQIAFALGLAFAFS